MPETFPLPSWSWGHGLPANVVTALVHQADVSNETAIVLERAKLVHREASMVASEAARTTGKLSPYRLRMAESWHPAARTFHFQLISLYVSTAAQYAHSVAGVSQNVLVRDGSADGIQLSEHLQLADVLERYLELVPLVTIGPSAPQLLGSIYEDARNRERANGELTHYHQQMIAALQEFARESQPSLFDAASVVEAEQLSTTIERTGPAAGEALHAYADSCLWKVAALTRTPGVADRSALRG